MDLNKSIKNWLLGCPHIRGDKMFFNALTVDDKNQAFLIDTASDTREDIMGNEMGSYMFTIVDFRAMGQMPVALNDGDIDDCADVHKINDWIKNQIQAKNYPTTDANFVIERMECPSTPILAGVQQSSNMSLAKYMIQVKLDYIHYK